MGSGWSRGSIRVRRQPFVFCLWLEEEGSRTKASMACWTHPTPCPHGFSSTPPHLTPRQCWLGKALLLPREDTKASIEEQGTPENQQSTQTSRCRGSGTGSAPASCRRLSVFLWAASSALAPNPSSQLRAGSGPPAPSPGTALGPVHTRPQISLVLQVRLLF